MSIIFMGSAEIACKSLEALVDAKQEVLCAVTQPDRPKGRNLKPQPCPLKNVAVSSGLKISSPGNVNSSESLSFLTSLKPEIIIVVAYGQILKKELLNIPSKGCINVHASLLPEYRGAAPIQRAIINGTRRTGVTTMFMDER